MVYSSGGRERRKRGTSGGCRREVHTSLRRGSVYFSAEVRASEKNDTEDGRPSR